MEANTSSKTSGVPSLLANVEVSHLDGFDTTTPMQSPKPVLHPDTGRPARVSLPLSRTDHGTARLKRNGAWT